MHLTLRQSFELVFLYNKNTAWKGPKYGVIYGPHFPVFGPNTEIYRVNLRN